MKAIIIARVSTEEQREAGNSLPAQTHRIEEYCKREKLEVIEAFSFDESAYKEKRDEFDRILDYLTKTKEKVAVCFDKVDRLSRNVFDKRVSKLYEMAVADTIELHFASDGQVINSSMSAVGKFQFGMSLGLAKYYSDAISDNVKRAFEQKLRKGEWIGQARIGYLSTNIDGAKDLIIDQEKAHIVRKMFELYATGSYSIKTLKNEVDNLGLEGRFGNKVSPSIVHNILTDKFYIGIMTSKGREYPHKYPVIVPRDLFERVQGILASFGKKKVKLASKPFALRGLVHCKRCGCTITGELKIKKNNPKLQYIYYSCSNFKGKCKRVFVREEDLLKPVREVLENIRLSQEQTNEIVTSLKELNDCKNEFHEKAIQKLQVEYAKLQNNLDRLLDLYIEGGITQEIYDVKMREYKDKQYNINIRLEEYTRADENYHIVASVVLSLANRALEIFESSEPNEKRQLLNFLLQNCLLSGRNLEFELQSPFVLFSQVSNIQTQLASPV